MQEERGMAARVSFRIVALLGRENDIPLLAVAVEKAFSLRLVDKKLAQLGLQDVSVRLLGGVEADLPGFIKEQNVADNIIVCGNGVTNAGEWCDDGNKMPLDGCYECSFEEGWTCDSVIAGNASKCYELCGDLIVVGSRCEGMPSCGIYGNLDSGRSTRAEQVLYENETMSIVCEPGLQPHRVDPFTNLLVPDLFGDRAFNVTCLQRSQAAPLSRVTSATHDPQRLFQQLHIEWKRLCGHIINKSPYCLFRHLLLQPPCTRLIVFLVSHKNSYMLFSNGSLP